MKESGFSCPHLNKAIVLLLAILWSIPQAVAWQGEPHLELRSINGNTVPARGAVLLYFYDKNKPDIHHEMTAKDYWQCYTQEVDCQAMQSIRVRFNKAFNYAPYMVRILRPDGSEATVQQTVSAPGPGYNPGISTPDNTEVIISSQIHYGEDYIDITSPVMNGCTVELHVPDDWPDSIQLFRFKISIDETAFSKPVMHPICSTRPQDNLFTIEGNPQSLYCFGEGCIFGQLSGDEDLPVSSGSATQVLVTEERGVCKKEYGYLALPTTTVLLQPAIMFSTGGNTFCANESIEASLANKADFQAAYVDFTVVDALADTVVDHLSNFSDNKFILHYPRLKRIYVYAQAKNGMQCIHSSAKHYFEILPVPQAPELEGMRNDCGRGATLVHRNPEYDVQYRLFDDKDQLIRQKGANYWCFRTDQYDATEEGLIDKNAHHQLSLEKGKYQVTATNDKLNCRSTTGFTIADKKADFNLLPLSEGVLLCQADSLYNLFRLFTPGSVRDKIEQEADNISYAFSVQKEGAAIHVSGRKFLHTGTLSPNEDYRVILSLTAPGGCQNSLEKSVSVIARPQAFTIKANGTAEDLLLCNNSDVVLSAGNKDCGIQWYSGGTLLPATGANINHNTTDGTSIYSAVASLSGCTLSSGNNIKVERRFIDFGDLHMDPAPEAYCQANKRIDLFDFINGTEKDNVRNMNGGWGYAFSSPEQGLKIEGHDLLLEESQASGVSPYTLNWSVSKGGCTRSFSKKIGIRTRPAKPVLSAGNQLLCAGETSIINAQSNASYYEWYKNGLPVNGNGAKYTHIDTGEEAETQYSAIALSELSENPCRSGLSDALLFRSNAPRGIFSLDKSCYNTTEKPVISISKPENIGQLSVIARHQSGASMTIPVQNLQLNIPAMPARWELYAMVKAADGHCERSMALGPITVANECPGGLSTTAPYMQACPPCEDCIPLRQIDDELGAVYEAYLQQWKAQEEYKSILIPTVTGKDDMLSVNILVSGKTGQAQLQVTDISGNIMGTQRCFLYEGMNEITLSPVMRNTGQWFLVKIIYPDHSVDLLKGFTR